MDCPSICVHLLVTVYMFVWFGCWCNQKWKRALTKFLSLFLYCVLYGRRLVPYTVRQIKARCSKLAKLQQIWDSCYCLVHCSAFASLFLPVILSFTFLLFFFSFFKKYKYIILMGYIYFVRFTFIQIVIRDVALHFRVALFLTGNSSNIFVQYMTS